MTPALEEPVPHAGFIDRTPGPSAGGSGAGGVSGGGMARPLPVEVEFVPATSVAPGQVFEPSVTDRHG
ncbi:hypothetical protein [Saccharothrix luteola]|uniref:hypothetical protein n=1 Tax=Saccharothrix luteola TaxID=2893018 RepID=UPI001E2B838B|nr:hypothetical protein [Saccharothrix luteola]MCC8246315.1 hypothetical protein [Saccharothrix luteola]